MNVFFGGESTPWAVLCAVLTYHYIETRLRARVIDTPKLETPPPPPAPSHRKVYRIYVGAHYLFSPPHLFPPRKNSATHHPPAFRSKDRTERSLPTYRSLSNIRREVSRGSRGSAILLISAFCCPIPILEEWMGGWCQRKGQTTYQPETNCVMGRGKRKEESWKGVRE